MSFIVIISLVDIGYFIYEMAYDGIETYDDSDFLDVPVYTLGRLGGKWPYGMREENQIWRFVSPIIMHANFMHITSNLFSQLIFGTRIESWFGTPKTMTIYILSGIAGNLFSAVLVNEF